jgi:Rrf2 family nitric oxide-sensitive transcriptional repressor
MKLTRFTDYSFRVLIFLGMRLDERVSIKEIAASYDISRHHLMKVVSNLTNKGYLKTWRGPGGGIALARPAIDINVGDVVRDMEEDLDIVACFAGSDLCVIDPVCRLKHIMHDALTAYMKELEKHSLQDLLENNPRLHCILMTRNALSPTTAV